VTRYDAVNDPDAHALALSCARTADHEQGADVVVLDVGDLIAISEYFVITSAPNRRLVRTLVDRIEERSKLDLGRSPLRIEGADQQQWVLMDYGDVVVHVFLTEIREFYDIERLYRDVPSLAWRDDSAAS
jgi:ribosome-associated protein